MWPVDINIDSGMACPLVCTMYLIGIRTSSLSLLCYRNALALLGAGYVLKRVLQEAYILANGMRAYFMAPRGLGRLNLKKYGQWAGTVAVLRFT